MPGGNLTLAARRDRRIVHASAGDSIAMRQRAILALGIGQCINWGVLYYAFAVLLLPVEQSLGLPRWAVAGAYSLALLVSAAFAPLVGRWGDRGHAPAVMQAGGVGAAACLALWSVVPGTVTFYLAWIGLGVSMACTLYEPAFAIVGRAHAEPAQRLRALAMVTLLGGLASTAFLPTTAWLVARFGWRVAVVGLAVAMLISVWMTRTFAFSSIATRSVSTEVTPPVVPTRQGPVPHLPFLMIAFGYVSLAAAAAIANLIPTAAERHLTPTLAATLGGTFGIMQLPGRALMMHGRLSGAPFRLLASSLGLQAIGLAGWALAPGVVGAVAGLMTYALGAGLSTLVRPYLVLSELGDYGPSYVNGRVAQAQQLARAAGPVLAAGAAHYVSYATLLTSLSLIYGAMALVALLRRPRADR